MLSKSWIEQSVFEIFKNIAHRYPKNIALHFENDNITYQDLLRQIETTAANIQERSTENKAPIAIWMNNHPDFIVAIFACLACGIPYVPLDNHFPQSRNREIIEHAKVQFILDKLDATENKINIPKGTSDSLAYILYTSGSSGKPKGVFQNQKNMLHDVWQYINSIKLTSTDNCTLFYSPSVNGAIRDIFGTLLSGASLYIKDLKKDGLLQLSSFIEENKITVLHAIPPVFRTLLQVNNNHYFSNVRLVYLAGDRIFKSDFELYKKHFKENAQLYIGLGSTESATIYRQWFLNHETKVESDLVPVGYAVEDRNITILPETNEIQVSSAYMALGYWNDKPLTLQYFQFNDNGTRTFNTGDVGEINAEGLLEFRGRIDKQIKINGHRVETDEILAKLKSLSTVRNAAIVIRSEKIIAYVETETATTEHALLSKLSEILPAFMLPYKIYIVAEIPLLANFKVDTVKLKKIDEENSTKQIISYNSLSIEERFKILWCKYVSEESYNKNWSWKSGGGTSVDAVNFLVDIEKTFSISFPFEIIHNEMNASVILENVQKIIEPNESSNIKKELPLVFVFHWLCGFPPSHRKIVASLSKYAEVKIINYPDYMAWKEEDQNFNFFCDALEKNMGDLTRPAVFIGLLSGSYFAQEMSRRYKGTVLHNIQFNCVAPEKGLLKQNNILTIGKNLWRKLSGGMTQEMKEHSKLLHTTNLKKLNTSATILVLNNTIAKYNNAYLGWNAYYEKIDAVRFSFNQIQMSDNENSRLEIEQQLLRLISPQHH
jgi:acyl-coenzyme A synthetase/AMP-(fatty) acid ligase/acyl carrier protein